MVSSTMTDGSLLFHLFPLSYIRTPCFYRHGVLLRAVCAHGLGRGILWNSTRAYPGSNPGDGHHTPESVFLLNSCLGLTHGRAGQ